VLIARNNGLPARAAGLRRRCPLKRGGADEPWNMQWQTIAEGKAKDATE
jgi:hypothetical protein